MKEIKIQYKGIGRAGSDQNIEDGYLDEAINVRRRNGKLTRRGHPTKLFDKPADAFNKIYYHDQEGINNYIGYNSATGEVRLINMTLGSNGTSTLIVNNITGENVDIVFLKRTMIVISDEGVKVFLYTTDNKYVQTATLPVPDVDLEIDTSQSTTTASEDLDDYDILAAAALANYYEFINTQSQQFGRMHGSIMYITAYRLFDGSYILPSIPRYFRINEGGVVRFTNVHEAGNRVNFTVTCSNLKATINNELYPGSIGESKSLVDSICVFATKVEPIHLIDDTTVNKALLTKYIPKVPHYQSHTKDSDKNFRDIFPVNKEFSKLAASGSWHKIHEFSFEEVVGKTGKTTNTIDLKGYYQDYAVRESLTADQFTHHSLTAREAYVYNDRLHLANIKTSYGKPYVQWENIDPTLGVVSQKIGSVTAWLKTSLGEVVVNGSISVPVMVASLELFGSWGDNYSQAEIELESFKTNQNYIPDSGFIQSEVYQDGTESYRVCWKEYGASSDEFVVLPSVVGYNNSRAYKIQIVVDGKLLLKENLKRNESMNFAYWHNPVFSPDELNEYANYKAVSKAYMSLNYNAEIVTDKGISFDTNRIQVSEIQNPLFFPAKNSYQVGTGSIIAIRSRSIPLSTGQFGQFPLQVFTTSGNWAMEQGSGDVLYSNIIPVNGEVATNKDQIISLSFGVTYSTAQGLFVVNGVDVTDITQLLIGSPNLDLQAEENYSFRLDHTRLVHLVDSLSSVDAKQYILGSKVGFDCVNNELIITNSSYNYSYVFSFESKSWFKISESFDLMINHYPQLLVLNGSGIFTLSVESFTSPIDILLTTRPCKIDGYNAFTLIHRVIQRCEIETPATMCAGFYIFASNDLHKWQLFSGSDRKTGEVTDIHLTRSHTKAKYFVFVLASSLNEGSSINEIDIELYHKLTSKIR